VVPEAGLEPAWPKAEGFSCHFGFRRRPRGRSWSGARLRHGLAAL